VGIVSEELAASFFRVYGGISTFFQNVGGVLSYQNIRLLIADLLNLDTVLILAAVLIHGVQTTHQTLDPKTYHVRRKNRQHSCLDTKYNFILYLI